MKKPTLGLVVVLVLAMLAAACAQILGIRPPERKPFPHHEHTAKAGIGCLQCHSGILTAKPTDPLHLPTTATCVGCHKQPHDPRECSGCHGLDSVREEAQMDRDHLKFSHATHSQRLHDDCAYCHRGVETNSEHIRPTMALCLSCHEHQDDFVAARACDRCHKDLPAEEVRPASHMACTMATGSVSTATAPTPRATFARPATRRSSARAATASPSPLCRRSSPSTRPPAPAFIARASSRATRSKRGRSRGCVRPAIARTSSARAVMRRTGSMWPRGRAARIRPGGSACAGKRTTTGPRRGKTRPSAPRAIRAPARACASDAIASAASEGAPTGPAGRAS